MSTGNLGIRYQGASGNLNGDPDADGDRFMNSDLEGMDGMESDLPLIDNHRKAGSTFGPGRYPKRELLLKGIGWAPGSTANGALRIRNKIEAMFADYGWTERWLYADLPSPGVSVMFKTFPGGKIHFPPPVGNSQAYEVPFTCANPIKYGQTSRTDTVNGTKTITNFGNYFTYIVATLVPDGAQNPWIQNDTTGGQRITLQGTIATGTTIDFYARRTLAGGTTLQEMAQRPRVWWPLLPGANVIKSNCAWNLQWYDGNR